MNLQEKQNLKVRFFGMHIGCEFDYLGKRHELFAGAIDYVLERPDCKLILRPLSSITDEEAIEALTKATGLYLCDVDRNEDRIVAVGVNHYSCAVIWLNSSPNPVGEFIEAWNSIKGHSKPDCHDYLAVDYLRSKGFALPFHGLDPVAEGWAVLSE